ncbi:MAG: hypothetical protein AAGF20_09435 [Pseudomonadota bacterium]
MTKQDGYGCAAIGWEDKMQSSFEKPAAGETSPALSELLDLVEHRKPTPVGRRLIQWSTLIHEIERLERRHAQLSQTTGGDRLLASVVETHLNEVHKARTEALHQLTETDARNAVDVVIKLYFADVLTSNAPDASGGDLTASLTRAALGDLWRFVCQRRETSKGLA